GWNTGRRLRSEDRVDMLSLPGHSSTETNIGLHRLLYYPRLRHRHFSMSGPRTLFDKLWDAHEIVRGDDGEALLWVDRHYVHEGSFHAFSLLAERGAAVAGPGPNIRVA